MTRIVIPCTTPDRIFSFIDANETLIRYGVRVASSTNVNVPSVGYGHCMPMHILKTPFGSTPAVKYGPAHSILTQSRLCWDLFIIDAFTNICFGPKLLHAAQRTVNSRSDIVRRCFIPGRAGGYPPTPPQTRTSAINASGSSGRAVAKVRVTIAVGVGRTCTRSGPGASGRTLRAVPIDTGVVPVPLVSGSASVVKPDARGIESRNAPEKSWASRMSRLTGK